ncbi:MAG: transglutaminase family protein [Chloroflexi bacterium]|nr:transglutaminase family protein [Chloroflexota bacterium]
MIYAITHLTLYTYSEPVTDSVMEVRKQPRSEGPQRSLRFTLDVRPRAKLFHYRDEFGNVVHTFDLPAPHDRLAVKSEAVVEVKPLPALPDSLPESAWDEIDAITLEPAFYDLLLPGPFTHPTPLLAGFAQEIGFRRGPDPLTTVRTLSTALYKAIAYDQNVTQVDSPIDDALEARRGVCQDYSHIMLTLLREAGIPSRYVSGYLFHRREDHDRSQADASHAWVEVWLPSLGWVGFDPTNNLIVGERHVRVCVARDYFHASPARGVFRGTAETELDVRVKVALMDELPVDERELAPEIALPQYEMQSTLLHQQAQQQQQ